MANIIKKFFNHNDIKKDKIKQEIIIKKENEFEELLKIANFLNVKFTSHNLKKLKTDYTNAFEISNNFIYLYPLNDGMPTCNFQFYINGELVIDNGKQYSQISNLDALILQMVKIFNLAIDNKIVLDPYYFMLELTDEVHKDYNGNANLIITDKAIKNQKLNEDNFNEANKYFINHFLDHYIGWNFGASINRNEELKKELEELNEKVINMGIREWAGPGLEVYGVEDEVYNGLQHYKLPTKKLKVKKKIKYN